MKTLAKLLYIVVFGMVMSCSPKHSMYNVLKKNRSMFVQHESVYDIDTNSFVVRAKHKDVYDSDKSVYLIHTPESWEYSGYMIDDSFRAQSGDTILVKPLNGEMRIVYSTSQGWIDLFTTSH